MHTQTHALGLSVRPYQDGGGCVQPQHVLLLCVSGVVKVAAQVGRSLGSLGKEITESLPAGSQSVLTHSQFPEVCISLLSWAVADES